MQQYRKNLGKVSLTAEGAWVRTKDYEILSIVYDEHTNHGFISRIDVPAGVDLYNKEYWMPFNVSGYADNNMIILSQKISESAIKSYTLEEAIKSIASAGRKPGAILGFYNENTDRLDIGGRWELWQYNGVDVADWENLNSWNSIYYNYNKFVGWYHNEDSLNKYVPFPEIGCYAYVGSDLNEAVIYRCDRKYAWTNTTEHVWNYIKVVVGGNVTVGENGNWFNNGVDTNIPASVKGENGKTPIIRNNDNVLEVSYDNVNWINISDEIAAWFRWQSQGGQQAFSTGKIQITRDGITWTDLSGEFVNNLRISRYIGADESLPTSGVVEGTIYAKGPYYEDTDTNHDYPAYRIWVYAWKGNTLAWVDHGQFTSIAAGIVQETGDSETSVMSQKATTKKLTELTSQINQEKQRAETSEQHLQESIDSVKEETLEENREMVNSILENYAPVEITGDVNNAADEEDLTSVNIEGTDVLKFKDKAYNPLVYSGLGRKILRKNINIDKDDNAKNILTQEMIDKENTIYEIRYDFDLNGQEITIPEGCVLDFQGGSLSNGCIKGNVVVESAYRCFKDISFDGVKKLKIKNLVSCNENIEDRKDKSVELTKAFICGASSIEWDGDELYYIDKTIDVVLTCDIVGNRVPYGSGSIDKFRGIFTDKDIPILKITYDSNTQYDQRTISGFNILNVCSTFSDIEREDIAVIEVTTCYGQVWGLNIDVDISINRPKGVIDEALPEILMDTYHYTGLYIHPGHNNGDIITQINIKGFIKGCYKAYKLGKDVDDGSSSWMTWTVVDGNTWCALGGDVNAAPTIIRGLHQAAVCWTANTYKKSYFKGFGDINVLGNLMDVNTGSTHDGNYIYTVSNGVELLSRTNIQDHIISPFIMGEYPIVNHSFDYIDRQGINPMKLYGSQSNLLCHNLIKEGIINIETTVSDGVNIYHIDDVIYNHDGLFSLNNLIKESNNWSNQSVYNKGRCMIHTRRFYEMTGSLWDSVYINMDIIVDTQTIGLKSIGEWIIQHTNWGMSCALSLLDSNKTVIKEVPNYMISDEFNHFFTTQGVIVKEAFSRIDITPDTRYLHYKFIFNRNISHKIGWMVAPSIALIGYMQETVFEKLSQRQLVINSIDNYKESHIYQGCCTVNSITNSSDYVNMCEFIINNKVNNLIHFHVNDCNGNSAVCTISIYMNTYSINISAKGHISLASFQCETYNSTYPKWSSDELYRKVIVKYKGNDIIVGNIHSSEELIFTEKYNGGTLLDLKQVFVPTKTGNSLSRPNNVEVGFCYYDTTLNKPIWCKDNGVWVDSTGVEL